MKNSDHAMAHILENKTEENKKKFAELQMIGSDQSIGLDFFQVHFHRIGSRKESKRRFWPKQTSFESSSMIQTRKTLQKISGLSAFHPNRIS